MSFGLEILNSSSKITYTTTDVTWNQVDFMYVSGGGGVTKDFPALLGREVLCVQILIDPPPINRRAIAHNIYVSGTTVSVGGGSENAYILVLMR